MENDKRSTSNHRKEANSRFREFVMPIFLIVYGFSHLYHIAHLRVRCPSGTFLRDFMETIQAPVIIMRDFGPFIGIIVAIWVLKTGVHRKINAIMLIITLCCCVISAPYAYRFVVFVTR